MEIFDNFFFFVKIQASRMRKDIIIFEDPKFSKIRRELERREGSIERRKSLIVS